MSTAMCLLSGFVYIGGSKWIGWVFIAYTLGGVGIGSFESNLLSAITPLGSKTKVWAIIGLPLGFNVISIGGFLLLSVGVPPVALYLGVATGLAAGMSVFFFRIPVADIEGNAEGLGAFIENALCWRRWLPQVGSAYSFLLCCPTLL